MTRTATIVGMLVTADGLYHQRFLEEQPARRVGLSLAYEKPLPVLRDRYGHVDSLRLRAAQPGWISLDLAHDPHTTRGELVHLQLRRAGDLWAVGVARDVPEGPLFFSPRVQTRDDGGDVVILDAALVPAAAQLGLPAVRVLPGDLDHLDHVDVVRLPEFLREMLARARATVKQRAKGAPVVVHDEDLDRADAREERVMRERAMLAREIARLEMRTGSTYPR